MDDSERRRRRLPRNDNLPPFIPVEKPLNGRRFTEKIDATRFGRNQKPNLRRQGIRKQLTMRLRIKIQIVVRRAEL